MHKITNILNDIIKFIKINEIYKKKYWQKNNLSVSGSGSNENITKKYSSKLIQLLEKYNIKSIFDLPCGDFQWMHKIVKQKKIDYIGGDILSALIKNLKKKYKNYKFLNFDIQKSFSNLKKNCKSKYIMISSHNFWLLKNYDIKTGNFRILDLEKEPFELSQSIDKIKDYKIVEFPKYVHL